MASVFSIQAHNIVHKKASAEWNGNILNLKTIYEKFMQIINSSKKNTVENNNSQVTKIGQVTKITLGRGNGEYVEYPARVKYVRV